MNTTTINGRAVETISGRVNATDLAIALAENYAAMGYRTHGDARNAADQVIDEMYSAMSELQRVAAKAPGMKRYGATGGVWLTQHQAELVAQRFTSKEV